MKCEPLTARLAISGVRLLPPGIRHQLIFGNAPFCQPLQKLLNRISGGSHRVQFCFEHGLLKGYRFECYSAEKYYYMREDFELEAQKDICEHVRPGAVAYDIGANIGMLSLMIAALGTTVYSFEPSPKVYPRLLRNIELNDTLSIIPQNVGASDKEVESRISDEGSMGKVGESGCLDIQLVRIDDFVFRDGNPKPCFIKIDVEGHGHKVLAGMPRVLAEKPVLMIEIHDPEEEAVLGALKPTYDVKFLEPKRYPYRILARPRGSDK